MNHYNPTKTHKSLLERAATSFDLTDVLRGPVGADLASASVTQASPVPPIRQEPPVTAQSSPTATVRPVARPPFVARRYGKVDLPALIRDGFIEPDAPPTGLAEEFRIVKRHLLLGAENDAERGRLVLVCSALPNEGKTFCAINLALSMASEHDLDVLLVDTDCAKPEILSTLGLSGGPGLIDAIADPAADVEDFIIRTDIENLLVLPAGRMSNDATELLASKRAREVFTVLLEQRPNRIVICDSAPALGSSTASVMALQAGQTLMVVRADKTAEPEIRQALDMLKGCPTIQLLLNGVSFSPSGRRFGAYYGYGD